MLGFDLSVREGDCRVIRILRVKDSVLVGDVVDTETGYAIMSGKASGFTYRMSTLQNTADCLLAGSLTCVSFLCLDNYWLCPAIICSAPRDSGDHAFPFPDNAIETLAENLSYKGLVQAVDSCRPFVEEQPCRGLRSASVPIDSRRAT